MRKYKIINLPLQFKGLKGLEEKFEGINEKLEEVKEENKQNLKQLKERYITEDNKQNIRDLEENIKVVMDISKRQTDQKLKIKWNKDKGYGEEH